MVNGIFGGFRPGYFEAIAYTDELIAKDALSTVNLAPERAYVKRTMQCRLVIDPVTTKSILSWLQDQVEQYEKTFGTIPSAEDRIIKP
jgi:hypothetical protein